MFGLIFLLTTYLASGTNLPLTQPGAAGSCPAEQLDCAGTCCPPAHPWAEGQREATCCGGGCCASLTTCSDPSEPDGACCTDQPTMPCPAVGSYPSRCCGRWTVCCATGTVGCCDPGLPWQGESAAFPGAIAAAARRPHAVSSTPAALALIPQAEHAARLVAANASAVEPKIGVLRALILEVSQLSVVGIDPASGKLLSSAAVRGYDNYGESTRPWAWSGSERAFVTVEANFTTAPPSKGGPGRQLVLTRIDALTGLSTSAVVSGATGLPAGYCVLDGGSVLLVGLHADESAATADDASLARFVKIDLRSARASPVASLPRGSDESSPAFYAAHFYACSRDGGEVVRVGAHYVSSGRESGVGYTQLRGAKASASFEALSWAKGGLGPLTLQPAHAAGGLATGAEFLSLAPQGRGGLALVGWTGTAHAEPKVIAKLGLRTAAPQVPIMGALGYLADALSADGSHYVALVSDEVLPAVGRWAVATVTLASGAVSLRPLSPLKIVATVSVSGLGLDTR